MANNGRPTKTQRFLNGLSVDPARRRRLEGDLAVLRIDIEHRKAGDPGAEWVNAAERCVTAVEQAIEDRELDKGWACLMAAERHMVDAYGRSELQARREGVLKEALSKLTDWRRDSVVTILAPIDGEGTKANGAAKKGRKGAQNGQDEIEDLKTTLKEALRVRDEHFFNVYRKIELRRKMLLVTAPILAAAIVLTYAMATENAAGYLGDPQTLLAVIVFGLFGGLISTAVSLANEQDASKRIPEHIASTYVTVARPIFGAGFAVAVYLALKSGVVTVFDGKTGAFALAAFLAGFSERWFLGIVSGSLGSQKGP